MVGVDDGRQRSAIVLIAQIPGVRPGKLPVADALGGIGHLLHPQIAGIGEHGREHRIRIVVRSPAAQLRKRVGEPSHPVHVIEQLGDPNPGLQVIELFRRWPRDGREWRDATCPGAAAEAAKRPRKRGSWEEALAPHARSPAPPIAMVFAALQIRAGL